MKKIVAILFAVMSVNAFAANTWKDPNTGITWTYTISFGKASVGVGSYSSPAVPTTTKGAITIPSVLGACPVTSIGDWAFDGCSALTSVTIPSSVTSIGDYTFRDCSSLTSVTIPSSMTSIGIQAFCYCSALTSVTIPSSVTSIGRYAFSGTPFYNNQPDGMVILGGGVLYAYKGNCPAIVTIPSSVTSISDSAFYRCSALTSVTIPEGVTSIGDQAFYDCSALTSINVDSANRYYCSIDGVLYNKSATELICCPGGAKSVTIPSSVTSIGYQAFLDCSALTSVTIPSSVTSIGDYVFYGCSSLTSVTIPSSVTSIGWCAFYGCSELKTVYVSSGDTERVKGMMSDSGVDVNMLEFVEKQEVDGIVWTYMVKNGEASVGGGTSSSPAVPKTTKGAITIPSTLGGCPVTSIGDSAFEGCTSLTSVTIPDGVTNVGAYAFAGCASMKRIDVPSMEDWLAIRFANEKANPLWNGAALYVDGKAVTELVMPEGTTEIGAYAFAGGQFTSVTIPDGVTNVGAYAFAGCASMKRIDVLSMEDWLAIRFANEKANPLWNGAALYVDGKAVTELVMPEGTTEIGAYAFAGGQFTSVMIPSSVTNIAPTAFARCSNILEVTCGSLMGNGGCLAKSQKAEIWLPLNGDFENIGVRGGALSNNGGRFVKDRFGRENQACYFNGQRESATFADIDSVKAEDTFTIAFWFKTEVSVSSHGSSSTAWNPGNYAFFPIEGGSGAGYGVKVGIDGIQVCEHGTCYMPTVLNYVATIGSDWNHVAVAVENSGVIRLYLNGEMVCSGNGSTRKRYACPHGLGGGAWGYYTGAVDDVVVFDYALSDIEIRDLLDDTGRAPDIFPDSYERIRLATLLEGAYAVPAGMFVGCSSLETVSFPAGVTNVDANAFAGCTNLKRVDVPSMEDWLKIRFANETANPLWNGAALYVGGKEMTELVVPEGTTEIGEYAFAGGSFTSVTIPSSVTNIGDEAFSGCGELKIVYVALGDTERVKGLITDKGVNVNTLEFVELPKPDGGPYTQKVDGIVWTYMVKNGEASVGGGTSSSPAVPTTTMGAITIPSTLDGCPVTSIGDWAFDGCSALTSVTIPSSVTSIGWYAFYGCSELKTVYVSSGDTERVKGMMSDSGVDVNMLEFVEKKPDGGPYTQEVDGVVWTYMVKNGEASVGGGSYSSPAVPKTTKGAITIPSVLGACPVTSIGSEAFYGCSALTSVTIPSSVTSIGEDAFFGCSALASVTIPSSVTSIGRYAFWNCSSLTSVTIPSSVTSIGSSAFSGTPFYNNQPDGMVILGGGVLYAYKGNCPAIVTIPSSVTSIGGVAFRWCSSLTSVTIPSSVTSIDSGAFEYCSALTSVTIPSSVTSIGRAAFAFCRGLTSVTIPSSVKIIGDRAFEDCSALTSVTIPSGVTSIGEAAFAGCSALTSINVDSANRYYCSINGVLYNKDATELICCPGGAKTVTIPSSVTSIGSHAFYGCSALTSMTIPSSVTSIGAYAFEHCFSLTSVTIPSSVTSIGNYAFYGCSSLASVTIPSSVTSIGDWAFEFCSSLTSVTIPSSVTSIGDYVFYGCSALTSIKVDSANGYYCSIDGLLYNKDATELICCPGGAKAVTIPSSVTSIGEWAFYGCSALTSVTIPSSVTSIGYHAFYNCSALTSVTIPSSVTGIGAYAFEYCFSLTSVTIPSSVTNIGDEAFSGCSKLRSVYISYGDTLRIKSLYDWPGNVNFLEISNPVFVPEDGFVFDESLKVSITNANEKATIYYTMDGSEPTINSPVYKKFILDHKATIKAIAEYNGLLSEVAVAHYAKGIVENPIITASVTPFVFSGNVISITCPTPNVQIYYTTDGTKPTAESTPYNGSFVIDDTTTIRAIAVDHPDYFDSEVVTQTFTREWAKVKAPICSLATGTVFYRRGQEVAISCEDGAAIYYTLDGSEPTHKSQLYKGPFTIDETTTIKMIAVRDDYKDSDVVMVNLIREWFTVEAPTCSLATGTVFYRRGQEVAISCEDGAAIYYTLDGSEPTHNSQLYNGPFTIDETTTIKMIAVRDDYKDSDVVMVNLIRGWLKVKAPTCSLATGTVFYRRGQEVAISCEDGAAIYYTLDGSEPTHKSQLYKGPFTIDETTTIKMIAVRDDYKDSDVVTVNLIRGWLTVDTPTIRSYYGGIEDGVETNELRGSYLSVVITCITDGATIHYTTDGNAPTINSPVYTEPFKVDKTTTIRALAVKDDYKNSSPTMHKITKVWTVGDSLNVPDMAFTDSGDKAWMTDNSVSHDGVASMKNGEITHNQSSSLSTEVIGSGKLSFWWKSSTEDWDVGQLIVDNVLQKEIAGENDWQNVSIDVIGDGVHTICWTYVKDETESHGEDCVWIDEVVWEPETAGGAVIADVTTLKEVFGAESSVVRNLTSEAELTKFNEFLGKCGITAANQISKKQKQYAYESFKLSAITVEPQLFEDEPKLKIDEFKPGEGGWSVTISLTAGEEAIAMAKKALEEHILVGTDLTEITAKPDIVASPSEDGASLTFTIVPPEGDKAFIAVRL